MAGHHLDRLRENLRGGFGFDRCLALELVHSADNRLCSALVLGHAVVLVFVEANFDAVRVVKLRLGHGYRGKREIASFRAIVKAAVVQRYAKAGLGGCLACDVGGECAGDFLRSKRIV